MRIVPVTAELLPALERYLAGRRHEAMFLRANLAAVGHEAGDDPRSGWLVAALEQTADGDERVRGAAASYVAGSLIVCCDPADAPSLARLAAARGRQPSAVLGPYDEATGALAGLGVDPDRLSVDTREVLYLLSLDALRPPAALDDGALVVRAARAEELDALAAWRVDYQAELFGAPRNAAQRANCLRRLTQQHRDDALFVCCTPAGEPRGMSAFNAALPDIVQIGGVYTPPAHRGQGVARACVADSLRVARARGVRESVLFTSDDNHAARRAYEAIGYDAIGDYRIAVLER